MTATLTDLYTVLWNNSNTPLGSIILTNILHPFTCCTEKFESIWNHFLNFPASYSLQQTIFYIPLLLLHVFWQLRSHWPFPGWTAQNDSDPLVSHLQPLTPVSFVSSCFGVLSYLTQALFHSHALRSLSNWPQPSLPLNSTLQILVFPVFLNYSLICKSF